jgi:hypothetical protein
MTWIGDDDGRFDYDVVRWVVLDDGGRRMEGSAAQRIPFCAPLLLLCR